MPRAASRRRRRTGGPASGSGRGFVLSTARPETVLPWARRGIAPLAVAELDGWSVIAPAGRPMARPPYDDPVRTLAGRPVGLRMRPALGFFRVGRQAVVVVHSRRWRAVPRWAVWTPHDGAVTMSGFPTAHPDDLVTVAGTLPAPARAGAEADLALLWGDGSLDAVRVLTSTLSILGLPGAEIIESITEVSDIPGARILRPKERHARAFDKLIEEQSRYAQEAEE